MDIWLHSTLLSVLEPTPNCGGMSTLHKSSRQDCSVSSGRASPRCLRSSHVELCPHICQTLCAGTRFGCWCLIWDGSSLLNFTIFILALFTYIGTACQDPKWNTIGTLTQRTGRHFPVTGGSSRCVVPVCIPLPLLLPLGFRFYLIHSGEGAKETVTVHHPVLPWSEAWGDPGHMCGLMGTTFKLSDSGWWCAYVTHSGVQIRTTYLEEPLVTGKWSPLNGLDGPSMAILMCLWGRCPV